MNLDWQHDGNGQGLSWTGFYQTEMCFDQQAMIEQLRRAIPDRPIESCRIANVWCVPGKRLDIVYIVQPAVDVFSTITIRFCLRGKAAAELHRVKHTGVATAGILSLPDWDAVGWIFPSDPDLPALTDMVAKCHLESAGQPMHASSKAPNFLKILSYLPGRRCALLAKRDGDLIVGKIGEGAAAQNDPLARLWDLPGRAFAMPEPVSNDPALNARWERFVAGERLETVLKKNADESVIPSVAGAIAALHATPINGLPERGAQKVFDRLERKVMPRIEMALPGLASRASDLTRSLNDQREILMSQPRHTIHGDLHTANLLFRNEQPVFIDLDDLAIGHAAYDLALLGSRLLLADLIGGAKLVNVEALVASLPSCYEQQGGIQIPEPVFAWYMATMLIGRQIKTCIRHAAPNLPALAERLVEIAEGIIRKGRYDGMPG